MVFGCLLPSRIAKSALIVNLGARSRGIRKVSIVFKRIHGYNYVNCKSATLRLDLDGLQGASICTLGLLCEAHTTRLINVPHS